ncbi:MAG TPA: hypothetical protein VN366_11710 [Feifaniaceae bacterium]|nr:hypothetical protein [Feifaniaceae bacterium]
MLCQCSGRELAFLSSVLAIQIASCVPEGQLELLAALYCSIGDQLALIAAAGCDDG